MYIAARRYDEAAAAIRQAVAMHPRSSIAHWYMVQVMLFRGSYAEALPHLHRAIELSPGAVTFSAGLGYAYAKLGERERALDIAAALTARYQSAYASPYQIALVYLGLGDREKAIAWLRTACDDRDGSVRMLKWFPLFDEIRDSAEYQGLLKRIGLADP